MGVEDPASGARVVSSNIQEDFLQDEVRVYIDDGTGFTPDTISYESDNLDGAYSTGDSVITLTDGSDFPTSGFLFIQEETSNPSELAEYRNKESLTDNDFPLVSSLENDHSDNALVYLADVVTESAESAQQRFRLSNFPVVRSSERIFIQKPSEEWEQLVVDTDYILNRGTGDLFIVDQSGLLEGTKVIALYTYYTNLVAEVQKVLEGDLNDSIAYPGVKAAGIHLSVEAPIIKRITVELSISAEDGFSEEDLAPDVQTAVEAYVNSRNIGEDVIHSRIITAAGNITGVRSVTVVTPTADITVLENERPLAADADGDSLVTVL